MKIARVAFGLLAGFIVLGISIKALGFLVSVLGALLLGSIGIHVSENQEALRDLEAAANILGLLAGLYLAVRAYRWLNPKAHHGADAASAAH